MGKGLAGQKKVVIPPGDVVFYDNCVPPLTADSYEIFVKSGIEGIDTGDYFDTPISRQFEVYAPRFSLSADEVEAVYPPDSSSADYREILPHIVLKNRGLPWERRLVSSDKTIPWLCLLAFQEGEIPIDHKTDSTVIQSTVKDFLAESPDVLKPAIDPGTLTDNVLQSQCRSIKISADAFKALTPCLEDLKYLTHARQGNTGNRVFSGSVDPGWFSVVVGSRFPAAEQDGNRYYVHLVSLEGFSGYLKTGAELPGKENEPLEKKDVQMITLYNWSFVSQARGGESFAELVENFVGQAGGDPEKLLLRRFVDAPVHPDETTKQVLERLNNGYVPITYQVSTGEETFAWYRGPCISATAQPLPESAKADAYPSASAAMIYDKKTGLFDQSYTAAWSLGRALALADGSYSTELSRFFDKAMGILSKLADKLGDNDNPSSTDIETAARRSAVRHIFADLLADGVGDILTGMFRNLKSGSSKEKREDDGKKKDPVATARRLLGIDNIREFLGSELRENILPVARWLGKRQLLYDVPAVHLIPDQRMLPTESLRFFYIDQNWLDLLQNGALSIGFKNSCCLEIYSALKQEIGRVIRADSGSTAEQMSGLLIRSAVVSGWPGLVIEAWKEKQPVEILRMDRLSNNVLLCLFSGIPDTVSLSEPREGLRFGVEDGDLINLRYLTGPVGKPMEGKIFPRSGGFRQFYREPVGDVGGNVLNINSGDASLVQTMQQAEYLGRSLGPADLAVEMVKTPERISFKLPSAVKKDG